MNLFGEYSMYSSIPKNGKVDKETTRLYCTTVLLLLLLLLSTSPFFTEDKNKIKKG